MTDLNWHSLLLLALGLTLVVVEIFSFTFKLLVLGVAALLMSLACYFWPVPDWGLVIFGVGAAVAQAVVARRFPRVAGVPAGDVIGAYGFVTGVTVRDGITYAVITFSKPIGGHELWKVKQTEPLLNQRRARVMKVNDDSTVTVEIEGVAVK
ncbi:hypothetical protein [Pseudomonas amygdali]|uniref:hypothetical protein n=1 Tax=Pseudomonas amygdali TaxID=47877 RepID=UPI000C33873A|nr:hypothetical protein [Pseudomonas amygdali]PWC98739.1 hypothetical protein CX658_32100 [Pseudomonas amygdali pv. lachrymans]PWC98789.1 hypothetical protein CX658_31745 [Pseudomonas amygdali pv. lachrymans]